MSKICVSQVNRDNTTTLWFDEGVAITVPTHESQQKSAEWWEAREERIAKMNNECLRSIGYGRNNKI